jgi:hypothetical protein
LGTTFSLAFGLSCNCSGAFEDAINDKDKKLQKEEFDAFVLVIL